MQLTSKAHRTDIVIDSLESSLENAQDFIVVRTPAVPDYHSGNKIIFAKAPRSVDELAQWVELYVEKFDMAQQDFIQFAWDEQDPNLELEMFKEQDFDVFSGVSMAAAELAKPARFNDSIHVRQIDWNNDLAAWVDLHIDPSWPGVSIDFQKRFWQMKGLKLQQLQEIFPGMRWVIEYQGELVGDVGLYGIKDIARFHATMVARVYRNQGFASRLIYEAAAHAKKHWQVQELLLVAEAGTNAHRLYTELGFVEGESVIEVTKQIAKKAP